MVANQAQTPMDDLTLTLGDTNTILLPEFPEGGTRTKHTATAN